MMATKKELIWKVSTLEFGKQQIYCFSVCLFI